MRRAIPFLAVVLIAVVLLAACGSDKPSPYAKANTALLSSLPVYPGATEPSTSTSSSGDTTFSARDWTLPATARPTRVIDWYVARLQARGWKVSGRSFDTIRAHRGHASVSIGARAHKLEVIANSRGA